MAKTLQETPITTPNARAKLAPGIYWRRLDSDVHLGCRRGKRAGKWVVRWRVGRGYQQAPLGTADDALKEGTLSFSAAEKVARAYVEDARAEAKALADGPPLTVRRVVEDYLDVRNARESARAGRQMKSDADNRLRRYLLGAPAIGSRPATEAAPLANLLLHKVAEKDLRGWRENLPNTLKPATVQRLTSDLKAALNAAADTHRDRLPSNIKAKIAHGLKLAKGDTEAVEVARENQILTDAQVSTLLRAAREVDADQEQDGDLFRTVLVLAATGARFSQIIRLTVGDFQPDQGRLLVPRSRKGAGAKFGPTPVPVGKDVREALLPNVVGRAPGERLLLRWYFKRAGRLSWKRSHKGPWQFSHEFVPFWDAIRTRAEMPEVVPYALRHTSIVRGIRANLPIRLVAALHDTSVPMIERHYGRWIADGLDEMAASAVVPLVPARDVDRVIPTSRDRLPK